MRNSILKELDDSKKIVVNNYAKFPTAPKVFYSYDINISYKNRRFVWRPDPSGVNYSKIRILGDKSIILNEKIMIVDSADVLIQVFDDLIAQNKQ